MQITRDDPAMVQKCNCIDRRVSQGNRVVLSGARHALAETVNL
jgi:hypothetical protein